MTEKIDPEEWARDLAESAAVPSLVPLVRHKPDGSERTMLQWVFEHPQGEFNGAKLVMWLVMLGYRVSVYREPDPWLVVETSVSNSKFELIEAEDAERD